MLNATKYSIDNFFINTLGFDLKSIDYIDVNRFYVSNICLKLDNIEYTFYLNFQYECLEDLAFVLLGDKFLDDEVICDLSKEIANQLVGFIKKDFDNCSIGIPDYKGLDYSLIYEHKLCYKVNNNYFFMGLIKKHYD